MRTFSSFLREEAEAEGDIFFATNDLAREGLDIERLNTVILATSQKDVNQSVGRAMRKLLADGDLRPLIIDFADNLSSFKNHARLRKKFYKDCKYNIEEYEINNKDISHNDDKIELKDCIKTLPVEIIIDNNINEDEKNEIDNINISNGKLVYTKKNVKKPLTQKVLLDILSNYYKGDTLKASEINNFILDR